MTKISQLSSIGDSLAIGDQFLIRDIDDAGSPNKSVTVSGITRALADGDATAPALAFAADKNTGIYRAGTDSLAVATNGVGRLYIDASGNVGVGTSSPDAALTVVGTGKFTATQSLLVNGTSGTYSTWQYNGTAVGDIGTGNQVFSGGANTDFAITARSTTSLVFGTNTTERLRITAAGLVGIGTSAPTENLTIYGASSRFAVTGGSGSSAILLGNQNSGGANNPSVIEGANGSLYFGGGNSWSGGGTFNYAMSITDAGLVGIGTTSPGATLHVEGSELRVKNGTGVPNVTLAGRDSDGTAILAFQNNGSSANNAALTATTNTLALATGGTERARIDSSGRLLVGTSSTSTNLRALIQATSANSAGSGNLYLARGESTPADGAGLGYLGFSDSNHVSAAALEAVRDGGTWTSGSSQPTRLVFSTTSDSASSPTERLRITSTGQVRLAGAGITFNGDTAAANELDDYEEGTWTPIISGLSTAGTGTYATQSGRYTKVGRSVYVAGMVAWTAHTGTGTMQIAGLPFTSVNATELANAVSFTYFSDITVPANSIPIGGNFPNTTVVTLYSMAVAGGTPSGLVMDVSGTIYFSITYQAA